MALSSITPVNTGDYKLTSVPVTRPNTDLSNTSIYQVVQCAGKKTVLPVETIESNIKDDLYDEVLKEKLFGGYICNVDKLNQKLSKTKDKGVTIGEIIQRYGLDGSLEPGELKEENDWYIGALQQGKGNKLNNYEPGEVGNPFKVDIPSKGIDTYRRK